MDPLDEDFRTRLSRNALLSVLSHGFLMALFPIATFSLFLTKNLGLSMFEVFALQAIFATVVAVLEVPSGYLADRVGYRRVLFVGALLGACGWAAYCLATDFASAMVGELMLAVSVSVSLLSGADTALLYESLTALGQREQFTRWFSRMRAFGGVMEGSAALLGAWMYASDAYLPFMVQVAVWSLNVIVISAFVEPPRAPALVLAPLERIAAIARFAATGAPRLRAVFALYLALALPSYVLTWVMPVYVERSLHDPALIGPIWAAASYVTAIASLFVPALERKLGGMFVLAGCVALVAIGYGGLGITESAWGFAFFFALCIVRGLQMPLLHREEQDLIPSSDRASLLSIKNLLFRGAFVALGPLIGSSIDDYGLHSTLIAAGAFFTVAGAGAWAWLATSHKPATAPSISANAAASTRGAA